MHSFFTAEPLMWSGPGFDVFGPAHLAWLVVCAALVFSLVWAYARLPEGLEPKGPRRTMLLVVGIIPIALRVTHDGLSVAAGVYTPIWWPLHLCNLCELLCLTYALRPGRALGNVVFSLTTLGSTLALLFPGWSYCPPLTYASLCGFLGHALMLAFALMIVVGRDVRPGMRDVWQPVVALVAYACAIYPFNKAFGTNFAFLSKPANNSPLVAMAEAFGNPGYLVPYAVCVLLVMLAQFALCELSSRGGRGRRGVAG